MFAVELFGRDLSDMPEPGVALVVALAIAGIFIANRVSGDVPQGNRVGRGEVHRCKRCGRDFQPEQVELLSNGEIRRWIDDHCPNCGWDLDWGSPNKPGGSSGRW